MATNIRPQNVKASPSSAIGSTADWLRQSLCADEPAALALKAALADGATLWAEDGQLLARWPHEPTAAGPRLKAHGATLYALLAQASPEHPH